jgi:hypothetical protein
MRIMNFTVEETNLIAIYKADSLADTVAKIEEAQSDIFDEDIIAIAESATRKLFTLSESEFSAISFTLDEDID